MTNKMEWLPAAIREPHPRPFPWVETANPKGCLHTTETSGRANYRGWTVMPHAEVLPIPGKGVEVKQFLPFSQASFALRHERPQPTNGDFIFQFELVGTCDPHGPGYFWPNADVAVLADLWHKVIKPLDLAFLIPFKAPVWDAYPGETNRHRMTDAQFDTYSGWLGHQHVPQNDHGDPGAFPWVRLAAIAKADLEKDDDMPLSDDDVTRIAQAVWHSDKAYIKSGWSGGLQSPAWHLNAASRYGIEGGFGGARPKGNGSPGTATTIKALMDELAAVKEGLDDLRRVVATIPHGTTGG